MRSREVGAFAVLVAGALVLALACGDRVEIAATSGESSAGLSAERVPESLRPLVDLAREWTLDDAERADRIDALSAAEKREIIARVDPHLDAIDEWVDSFEPGSMPDEVSAFFWMRLAVEEMRY